ncbi:MAG: helix-turn-helix transcriptional regulator [Paludibacteraceae bacterium]|nr:helix-turn-helix transcriptional regulator [Paludibacteraceae bacterium]
MDGRQKIQKIMESENLNARQFAERVGISAGTLSNILNGRNNPSLDVMQNILNSFRTISSDWLILDSGPMYRTKGSELPQEVLFDIRPTESQLMTKPTYDVTHPGKQPPVLSDKEINVGQNIKGEQKVNDERKVVKILIFYSDGTFEER